MNIVTELNTSQLATQQEEEQVNNVPTHGNNVPTHGNNVPTHGYNLRERPTKQKE